MLFEDERIGIGRVMRLAARSARWLYPGEAHRSIAVAPVTHLVLLRGPRLMLIYTVLAFEVFQICLALGQIVLLLDHLVGLVV